MTEAVQGLDLGPEDKESTSPEVQIHKLDPASVYHVVRPVDYEVEELDLSQWSEKPHLREFNIQVDGLDEFGPMVDAFLISTNTPVCFVSKKNSSIELVFDAPTSGPSWGNQKVKMAVELYERMGDLIDQESNYQTHKSIKNRLERYLPYVVSIDGKKGNEMFLKKLEEISVSRDSKIVSRLAKGSEGSSAEENVVIDGLFSFDIKIPYFDSMMERAFEFGVDVVARGSSGGKGVECAIRFDTVALEETAWTRLYERVETIMKEKKILVVKGAMVS